MISPEMFSDRKNFFEPSNAGRAFDAVTYSGEAVRAFRSHLSGFGILTNADLLADGGLHRFHIEGHSRGTMNGAYVLHVDGHPAGWFTDFKSGVSGKWRLPVKGSRLKPAGCRQIAADRLRALAKQEWLYRKSASYAKEIYGGADQARCHGYLRAKNIPSCIGLKLTSNGTLLVPASDLDGKLWSVQRIWLNAEGRYEKRFLAGCRVSGCSFKINGDDVLGICEGISTGISIRKVTGHTIFCAFSVSNILRVAKGIRERNPHARIILYADNDKSAGNPGVTFATKAAKAVRGDLCVPPITGADWNDILSGGVR